MRFGMARNISLVAIAMLGVSFQNVARAEGQYGFETNIPTFFLGGYHGSLWYGSNGHRARFITAKAVYPSGLTEAGFKDKTLTFLEMEFDFFLGENAYRFRGPWFSGGFGRTKQEITSEKTGAKASIDTNDFHFGAGYVFEVATQVTLNPWVGGDYHLNAPNAVSVGTDTWSPKRLELVGGIKLGIDF